MKDIFKILQEEKDRILEMHESATKNQYLGEQTFGAYNTGNYQLDSAVKNFYSQPQNLTPKPKKNNKSSSYTTKEWNQFSPATTVSGNVSIGFKPGVKFEATNNPYIVTAKNVNVLNKDVSTREWVTTQGQKRFSFYCQQGKFYFQGNQTGYVSAQLSKALVKYVCGYKGGAKQPGTEQPGTEQPGTEQPGTGQPGTGQPGTGQPNTQVIELNKQIQQLLGNQQPTGQITDTDIDAILTKLG